MRLDMRVSDEALLVETGRSGPEDLAVRCFQFL